MAKKKPMTRREKALRAECKKQLQADGVIPPDKKPLNRKKFVSETVEAFDAQTDKWGLYINNMSAAIGWMLAGATVKGHKVTPEQVGVAKLLKMAMEIRAYEQRLRAAGKTEYKLDDMYHEVIKPIEDL